MVVQTARLFFALWPGDRTRSEFVHATRKAVRTCGGRPVSEGNVHATLVFLGSVAVSRLPEVVAIAAEVAGSNAAAPFDLVFDRVEYWEKARILVAAAHASAGVTAASALARGLLEAMVRAGFDADPKPFRPHVTLARKVGKQTRPLEMHAVTWGCYAFALVESRTLPEGPVYSVVESFPLAEGVRRD